MIIRKHRRPDCTDKTRKSKNINFRVSQEEYERIKKAANSKGLTVTKWLDSIIFRDNEK